VSVLHATTPVPSPVAVTGQVVVDYANRTLVVRLSENESGLAALTASLQNKQPRQKRRSSCIVTPMRSESRTASRPPV
jgi:hypothetical protein